MIGSVNVLAMPEADVTCANSCHERSSSGSVDRYSTVRSSSTALTHGPSDTYCTPSRAAISASVATKVNVTPSASVARLIPTHSGTKDRTRAAMALRRISASSPSDMNGPYSSMASAVSGIGSTECRYPPSRQAWAFGEAPHERHPYVEDAARWLPVSVGDHAEAVQLWIGRFGDEHPGRHSAGQVVECLLRDELAGGKYGDTRRVRAHQLGCYPARGRLDRNHVDLGEE